MRLLEQLGEETEALHVVIDGDVRRLLDSATAEDYRCYVVQLYGFVAPLERAILKTPDLAQSIDVRRFQKHELLRRDLSALRMTADEIAGLAECAIPQLGTPEEALGWAYPIERSTLGHSDLFRRLAAVIPGEVAFASSYLKASFGAVGETWRSFGSALEVFEDTPRRAQPVIASAKASYHCLRAWRVLHETRSVMRVPRVSRRQHA